jgi:predicted RNA-binding Zn-ribbon protein involved in translation (DUF1610 family)
MAQKTFSCTACGQPIEVPDGFSAAVIDCPHCGAPHSRHSERPYISPRAAKMAQPGAPLVAGNMPPQPPMPNPGMMPPPPNPGMMPPPPMAPYPPRAYMGPPPAPRNNTTLFVILGVVGAALIGGGILLFMLVFMVAPQVTPTPPPAPPTTGHNLNEVPTDWVKHASTDGRFRAEFPIAPTISAKPFSSRIGSHVANLAISEVGGIDFWVVYWDLGIDRPSEYVIDIDAALRALTAGTDARVTSTQPLKLGNNNGVLANFTRVNSGLTSYAASVRAGNRVFIVCADGRSRDAGAYWPRFLAAFSFDDELNFLETMYFDCPGRMDLLTGQQVSLRLRGSGGKAPYTWKATGLPRGLEVRAKNDTSGELAGSPQEAGSYSAAVIMVDALQREFKSPCKFEVSKAPENAGTMTLKTIKGRAGMPISGRVVLKPAATPESVQWTWDETQAPKGVTFQIFTPDLVIGGTPEQGGKFSVALTCKIKLKDSGLELESQGTLEFDLTDAWPDVASRFGKSTLLIQHNGVYSPEPWKYLLTTLAKRCESLGAGEKINIWTLTGFGRTVSTKDAGPQPNTTGATVAKLLRRDAEKTKEREGAASKDLAGIAAGDYQGYDRIILITNLVQDQTNLPMLKTELERLKATGAEVDIVIIHKDIPEEFTQWLAEKKIGLIHYKP